MWLLYALLTVLFTTTLGISFRKIALVTKNPRAFAFVYNFTMFIIALTVSFVLGIGTVDLNRTLFILLCLSGIGYGLFQRYQFVVRKHIEASVIQTIVMPSGIIGFSLAVIWLGESITLLKVSGYALILMAAFLVIRPKRTIKFDKYIMGAFIIGALLSISGTIDRHVSPYFSSTFFYVTILLFFHALIPFLPRVSLNEIKSEIKSHRWQIPILATTNVAALVCLIAALKLAPATKVQPISQTNVVAIALAGIIILHERKHMYIKILAAIITFVGLFLISR